ncbi:tetratricopeptide repeat protein [Anatilimnocola floriformis]|uniref:tetratricopeptide repeat protein n=1 Tax=Anatilimnocola floriformis TaxID=2948575 RepID=UPI0020C51D6C|nr:tetratricopeptide repeat protein [Anatilimnocola floriformis]
MQRKFLHDLKWLIVLAVAATSTGCAGMPGRDWFTSWKPSLPSPGATVAKEEKIAKAKDAKVEENTVAMEIARGRNFEKGGQLDKARKVYEDLRKKHPENYVIAHRLGVVADSERRHGEAEQLFMFALERQPNDAQIINDLGYCYYLQGKLTQAEPYARRAVALQPANSRFRNNLGLVLGHMGNVKEALVEFRAAGNEADAMFNMAFIYASQDRTDDSKACFRYALAIDPTHRRAREALASFEEYENKPAALRDQEMDLAENGGRWVPYQEGGSVQQASATAPLPQGRDAGKATRALQMQAKAVQSQNSAAQ